MTPASALWRQVTKKIKSVQMFRKPVGGAKQGDRVGVCVTQFDPKLLERGVVCTPGSLRTLQAAVVSVRKISYFKGSLATRAKFHITLGHDTLMAKVTFFGLPPPEPGTPQPLEPHPLDAPFALDRDYVYQEEYGESGGGAEAEQWALLEFERPVTCPSLCLVIGSKLDADLHANACRLAFHGRLLLGFQDRSYVETELPRLRIYKTKKREGQVERVSSSNTLLLLHGLTVVLLQGEGGGSPSSTSSSSEENHYRSCPESHCTFDRPTAAWMDGWMDGRNIVKWMDDKGWMDGQ